MPYDVRGPLLAAAACFAAFGLLAFAAYDIAPIEHLDLRLFLHLQLEGSPLQTLANVLVHLGDLGPLLMMMAAIVALGLHYGRRREVVAATAVIVGANLLTQVLKIALEHSRLSTPAGGSPSYWAQLLPTSDAFPSGHTTAAAAVAVALLLVVPARHARAAAIAGGLLIAAVASSVVVSGWHYPSDALGAVLIAAACGFLALAGLRAPGRRDRPRGRNVASPPGRLLASGD
jgi:membrane-associated phospholipid phosphatase